MTAHEKALERWACKSTTLDVSSISMSWGRSRVFTSVEIFLLNLTVSVPGCDPASVIWELLGAVYSCITLVQVVSVATVQHQM